MQVKTAILRVLQENEVPMTFNALNKQVKWFKCWESPLFIIDKASMLEITLALEELIAENVVVYLPSKKQFSFIG